MTKNVRHPGSALGEAVGKLIEADLIRAAREVATPPGFSVLSTSLRNHMGNRHQIDGVVTDKEDNPVILIEPKYLRYKKHNWDKGSRLCIAHYSLRRTYRSIRKSIGVLAGRWTDNSIEFIQSFGVEVHRISFAHLVEVLAQHQITFQWGEKDMETPEQAWLQFCQLGEETHQDIARALTVPVRDAVQESLRTTLEWDPSSPRRVEAVELSIRTAEGEHLLYSFDKVSEAIQRLVDFVKDSDDVGGMFD